MRNLQFFSFCDCAPLETEIKRQLLRALASLPSLREVEVDRSIKLSEIHALFSEGAQKPAVRCKSGLDLSRGSADLFEDASDKETSDSLFAFEEMPHIFVAVIASRFNRESEQLRFRRQVEVQLFDLYRYAYTAEDDKILEACRAVLAKKMVQGEKFPELTLNVATRLWQAAEERGDSLMRIFALIWFAEQVKQQKITESELPLKLLHYGHALDYPGIWVGASEAAGGRSAMHCQNETVLNQTLVQLGHEFKIEHVAFGKEGRRIDAPSLGRMNKRFLDLEAVFFARIPDGCKRG